MGRLIAIIGNSGVGKTTLAALLQKQPGFAAAFEEHQERPFQALFKKDPRYALPNQVDYLLLRAEQEQRLRQQPLIGVLDGGLDLDFHLFTKLFYRKGWLSKAEFLLLERLYTLLRLHLPPPEMFIYLKADISVITERFRHRARSLEIATLDDLQSIQALLEEWIPTIEPGCLFCIDTTQDDALYSNTLARLRAEIQRRLGGTG